MSNVKRGFTFNKMQVVKPKSSKFNLSHDHLTAIRSGIIVPIWWTEGLPGSLYKCSVSSLVRLFALSSPMMQREDIKIRAFKVPVRILAKSKDVETAFTGGKDGQHIDFPMFRCDVSEMKVGTLYDYLELPLPYKFNNSTKSWEFTPDLVQNVPDVSALPFLAYHRIFNDWFRNEDTEDDFSEAFELSFSQLDELYTSDAISEDANYNYDELHKVSWERDYFTSALKKPQRGDQVSIPLVGQAKVVPSSDEDPQLDVTTPGAQSNLQIWRTPDGHIARNSTDSDILTWKKSGLVVDGSSFTGIGAVALRTAMNLQAFLERNNIAGYRLIENILAHFGVQSSNKLLDYAEYIGGISAPVTVRPVDQTSASTADGTPQGTQTGIGQSAFSDFLFRTFCEEHCIIMVVAYITGKSSYSQGLARKWTRRTYLDYYWPEFQTIGEQEIKNKEIFFDFFSQTDNNDSTWAYQSRYSEYKYEPDSIAGDFRTTLSYWHQSRLFTSLPPFNNNFVLQDLSDRVFALDDQTYPNKYLCDFYFDCEAVLPMSKYSNSKLW